ncbi:nucleotide exchange factor GrpE [Bacteroidales bacterium OttesenSCG-928-K03]|nr:nucleotide exchange factor GrpE [Bacteroidales bacterium OttesenSCG-928-L14]MDL2240751.1 nucleotide exchange factor GrpE [Bacteroidales bacterium OttesenSCG-928-K22]MDL2242240.1 nucleotide exchange factor GrpE [Bacteroidales bacterium OttesenSCG-928-K03]
MIEKDDIKSQEYQDDEDVSSMEDLNSLNGNASNSKKKKSSNKNKSDKMAEENEKLRTELAETKDKFLRLFSEFDNFRKRTSKEKIDIINSAGENVISKLLPVLDDIDRAEVAFEKTNEIEALKQGNSLIFEKLKQILLNCGLKEMKSTGDDFDPDIHEAIANFPTENEEQKNKIIDTTEKGYTLNDKVIRTAKVVVGN